MRMKKGARSGGKYTGSHTTVVPGAAIIADIADQCAYVTKIALGYIKGGLPPAKGLRRIKILVDTGSLLVTVRDNISQQELRVYTNDKEATKRIIATHAREAGFRVLESSTQGNERA
jgi:Predicted metal-binding protein (DUF2103)